MWMEETIGKKVNDERAQELIATGATRVATACPFCYIMIDDGVKGARASRTTQVRVADISMHLLEAIERGEREAGGVVGGAAAAAVGPVGPVSEPSGKLSSVAGRPAARAGPGTSSRAGSAVGPSAGVVKPMKEIWPIFIVG